MNSAALTDKDKREFARQLIKNGGDRTAAYQAIRPEVTYGSANSLGSKLSKDELVQKELNIAADRIGITPEYVLDILKKAADSGLGKKSTNKDSIQAVKEISRLLNYGNNDSEPLDGLYLEKKSEQELVKELEEIKGKLDIMMKGGAEEGEIIDL